MKDLRIVSCPRCGHDKWARIGLRPGEPEPPCFDCAIELGLRISPSQGKDR